MKKNYYREASSPIQDKGTMFFSDLQVKERQSLQPFKTMDMRRKDEEQSGKGEDSDEQPVISVK